MDATLAFPLPVALIAIALFFDFLNGLPVRATGYPCGSPTVAPMTIEAVSLAKVSAIDMFASLTKLPSRVLSQADTPFAPMTFARNLEGTS